MECPKCHSHNAHLCSMAHEQGTTTTVTYGGAGRGSFDSTSQTTTALGKRAAPPKSGMPVRVAFAAITGFLFLSALIAGHGDSGAYGGVAFLFLLFAAAAYLLYRKVKSLPQYTLERERWEKSWICAACGNIFVPETAAE